MELFALDIGWGTTLAIKTIVVLIIIPTGALILGYVFLLKMMSHMQSRLGPMDPGGFHGWYQLIGDGLKFLQKEDVMPAEADRRVFAAAPAVVVLSTFLVFAVIPMGPDLVVKHLDVGIFYALAISSLSTIGVLMAGWSSANKYSLMGGLSAAGQLIAYELPLVLAVVGPVILAGTMSMQGLVTAQIDAGYPYVIFQFVGFVIFMIAALAELTRIPFDMPIAESELVMGYLTEYSGFRFLFFFLAEFANMFTMSAIAVTLFLGGYWLPGIPAETLEFAGPLILIAKTFILVFVMIWFRWTFPRFREDQLQRLAWKVLVPLALLNIAVTATLKVLL
jgi:NADH-quinone oxidoreductase subunit H